MRTGDSLDAMPFFRDGSDRLGQFLSGTISKYWWDGRISKAPLQGCRTRWLVYRIPLRDSGVSSYYLTKLTYLSLRAYLCDRSVLNTSSDSGDNSMFPVYTREPGRCHSPHNIPRIFPRIIRWQTTQRGMICRE